MSAFPTSPGTPRLAEQRGRREANEASAMCAAHPGHCRTCAKRTPAASGHAKGNKMLAGFVPQPSSSWRWHQGRCAPTGFGHRHSCTISILSSRL